jgi:asparagine synthase (glutamine-hydrolysing)
MSKETTPVNAFTIAFEGVDPYKDEWGDANDAATMFRAEFSGKRVSDEDYIAFMEKYMWHLEEPVGNESAAAYYFVAQLAHQKVKVLLSGQGADEHLAGYGRHLAAQYVPYLEWMPSQIVKPFGSMLLPLFRGQETPARLVDALAQKDENARFLSMYSITSPEMRQQLFNLDFTVQSSPSILTEYIRSVLARAPLGTMLEKMTYIDTRTSLSDNLLMSGDKMAMAMGIEMRVPFLDIEIMKVVEAIPGRFKVRAFENKAIHKKVCERWLPRENVYRRKVGFNTVMGKWLKQNLEGTLTELFEEPDSITRNLLNIDYVRRLQAEHSSGKHDHQRILFLLLSIEMWRKVFI